MIIVSSPGKGRCPEPSLIPETLNYQPPLNAIMVNRQHAIDPYAPNYHSIISDFISTGETRATPSRTVCSPATEGRIRCQRIRRAVDTVDSYCKNRISVSDRSESPVFCIARTMRKHTDPCLHDRGSPLIIAFILKTDA